MALKETLSKKLGPLPLGVWLLAVAGGLGLSFYMQRKTGEEELTEEEEDGFLDYSELPYSPPNFGGAVTLPDYGTVGPVQPRQQTPETNDQWLQFGVEWLISTGTNALAAQNGLSKYLEGKSLTVAEQAMVSRVIRAFGSPPEGAPTLEETPPPVDPPDTPTTAPRWHSTTPADVVAAYSAPSVATVLLSLGVDYKTQGPSAVDRFDVAAGLRKLGWKNVADLALTVRNVGRLLAKTKPAAAPSGTGYVWHSSVPSAVRLLSVRDVVTALRKLRVGPSTRFVTTQHVRAGLLKLGYKKTENLRGTDPRNVKRLIALRRAQRGE